jgi:alpha-tubulin suppressor-like RCC1 family protein
LKGWGWNNYGQLDNGFATDQAQATPERVSLNGVVSIGAGQYHSLAVRRDGSVWGWGKNSGGQLGDGTTTDRSSPVQVVGLTGAVAVAGGWDHSIALRGDGTVWAWGANYAGQLGDGTTASALVPRRVPGLTDIIAIAANRSQSFALADDGTLWGWGYNGYGQLGDGTTTDRSSPVAVLSGVTAVAAGYLHTLALRSDGTVWAWGANYFGQLGLGTQTPFEPTPQHVSALPSVSALGAGYDHSLAVAADGTVYAWGYNQYGQAGDSSLVEAVLAPTHVPGLTGIVAVAGGLYHSVALGANGRIYGWGSDAHGQLGDGTANLEAQPVPTLGVVKGVDGIASGSDHVLAGT